MRTITLLVGAALLSAPRDFDAKPLPGSPLDSLKRASGVGPRYSSQLLPLPSTLLGAIQPLTSDAVTHAGSSLKKKTARPWGEALPKPVDWDMKAYPPTLSDDVYAYAMLRCMAITLHKSQMSEAELIEAMIEMGDGASDVACAAKSELPTLAKAVAEAIGTPPRDAPAKPEGELAAFIVAELATVSPYEPAFGRWMTQLRNDQILPILLAIIEAKENLVVTRNAVFMLRCIQDPKVVPVLRDLLKSNDKVIRNRAIVALVGWEDEKTAEWLAERLAGDDVTFRTMAAWALGKIGSPKSLTALIEAAVKGGPEFLWSALPAIARLADKTDAAGRKQLLVDLTRLAPIAQKDDRLRAILEERQRIAAARAGDADAIAWMRKLGVRTLDVDPKKSLVQYANIELFNETIEVLSPEPKK